LTYSFQPLVAKAADTHSLKTVSVPKLLDEWLECRVSLAVDVEASAGKLIEKIIKQRYWVSAIDAS
jgi:hypothetical protein